MSYTNVYPTRINWENEPSIASPINATNLNKMDYALYSHDQTLETWDTTKANQSDLLLSVKSIDYNTSTGVFVFTWQNGTTKTVDLNIEKIPVSFSMSPQGVITMTTEDGTQYTADVGSLIKTYTFTDSTEIDFTVTTDASGNKTVTAALKDGSIVGTKLEPNYLANCQSAANSASASKTAAEGSAEDSEAWAVGTRDGVPVPSTDPAYNNNSKYWAEHTTNSFAGLTDTDITNPQDGQVPVYNSSSNKWENADPEAGGGSSIMVMTSESSLFGRTVTITCGTYTASGAFSNSGEVEFTGVTATGTFTIATSTSGGTSVSKTLSVPYFGNYSTTITLFSATITATFPADRGATCTCDGVTASTSPYTFTVGAAGTYPVQTTLDGASKSVSVNITTDGQSESVNFAYGTINLTFSNEFRSSTITCGLNGTTITKTAPSSGNTMAFYPPTTGTWTISGTYSGTVYQTEVTVSSLSTPVSAQLRTTVNATVTLHGAAGAIISYTDETGSQTQTLDTGGSKTDVTIKANPNFPVVVFEDTTVGKKPCDLSANFKKSVVIKPSLTDIYVMPDNSLYWYGYEDDDFEDTTTANGWGGTSYSLVTPTHNTTDVLLSSGNQQICGVGAKTTKNANKINLIVKGETTPGSSNYGEFCTSSSKAFNSASTIDIKNNSIALLTRDTSALSDFYYFVDTYGASMSSRVSALWHNTDSQYNFFSAADDVVTFKDSNNNDVVFAITDENGGAYVDYSAIPSGSYTLYSSVAKNPDSLSDAYSKQVSISSGTTSVYFMPNDNVLYWWGYESDDLEDVTTANGWSNVGGNPAHNKNSITLGQSTAYVAVASKTPVSGDFKAIYQGSTARNGKYGLLAAESSKSPTSATNAAATNTSLQTLSLNNNTSKYIVMEAYGQEGSGGKMSGTLSALWYE